MSFDFGSVVGLGRAIKRHSDAKHEERLQMDAQKREENRAHRDRVAKFFENIAVDPSDYPDGADQAASRAFFRIVSQPLDKYNPKLAEKELADFNLSTARQVAMDKLGLSRARAGAEAGAAAMGVMGAGPEQIADVQNQLQSSLAQQWPTRTVQGQLTPDERQTRAVESYRAQREAMREIDNQYAAPVTSHAPSDQTIYQTMPDGSVKIVSKGTPKRDTTTTLEDIIFDKTNTYTPEEKAEARRLYNQRTTNHGDLRTGTGMGGMGLDPDMVTWYAEQRRLGNISYAEIPKEYRNSGLVEAEMRNRGWVPGMKRTHDSETKKAEFAQMVDDVRTTLATFDKHGDLGTGMGSNALYWFRSKGMLGRNDPEIVQARAELSSAASDRLHQLSGAAISPMEMRRLERSIPTDFTLGDEEFRGRLNAFYLRLNRVYERRYGPNGIGPPTGPDDRTDVDPDGSALVPSRPTAQTATPQSPPGRSAVLDTLRAIQESLK